MSGMKCLQEQVEHLQRKTKAGIKHDALILCQGVDSGPHLTSHVVQGHFGLCKESGQPSVILKLVIVHHFMHLPPSSIGLGAKTAGRGLMFVLRNSVLQNSRVGSFPG